MIECLDVVLDVAGLEQDCGARAMLAVALCDQLDSRLGGERRAAVEAARDFWISGEVVEYRKWFGAYSAMLDEKRLLDPLDRLVWSALARSGGLDSFTGESLVLEAVDAGLDPDEISIALSSVVPGYGNP
jgi:hypothetical protein